MAPAANSTATSLRSAHRRLDERRHALDVGARLARDQHERAVAADQIAHSWPSTSTICSARAVRGSMNSDTGWPLWRYMMCAILPSPYRHGREPTSSSPARSELIGSCICQPKPRGHRALDASARLVRAEHGVHREALHVIGGEFRGHARATTARSPDTGTRRRRSGRGWPRQRERRQTHAPARRGGAG